MTPNSRVKITTRPSTPDIKQQIYITHTGCCVSWSVVSQYILASVRCLLVATKISCAQPRPPVDSSQYLRVRPDGHISHLTPDTLILPLLLLLQPGPDLPHEADSDQMLVTDRQTGATPRVSADSIEQDRSIDYFPPLPAQPPPVVITLQKHTDQSADSLYQAPAG